MKKSQIHKKNNTIFQNKNTSKLSKLETKLSKLETVDFDQVQNGIWLYESNQPIYEFYNKAYKKIRKYGIHQNAGYIDFHLILVLSIQL